MSVRLAQPPTFVQTHLGRVLLSVLTRRAELGIDTLKPGEGLLPGQGGMGAAALAAVRDTALRGVGRAKDSTVYDEAAEKALVQQRITMGIARACANLNDMEVAIDYTRRLMDKFMSETQNYPADTKRSSFACASRDWTPSLTLSEPTPTVLSMSSSKFCRREFAASSTRPSVRRAR